MNDRYLMALYYGYGRQDAAVAVFKLMAIKDEPPDPLKFAEFHLAQWDEFQRGESSFMPQRPGLLAHLQGEPKVNYPDSVIDCALEVCRFCGDTVGDQSDDCPSDEAEGRPCLPILDRSDIGWAICDRCKGDGVLKGYPGVYTQDMFDEDPDMLDDYLAHRRGCEECGATGKVRDVEPNAELDSLAREYYESEHIARMERWAGA